MANEPKYDKGSRTSRSTFERWLKEQVKLVTAVVAACPITLDYLGAFDHLQREKPTTAVVSILGALVFLSVYWLRAALKSGWWLLVGFVVLGLGIAALWTLDWPPVATRRVDGLYDMQYALGMLLSVCGVSVMFVAAFVRHVGRPRSLLELAPALARKQWQLLSNVAETLVGINDAMDHFDHRVVVEQPFRQSADFLIREAQERLEPLRDGMVKLRPFNPHTVFGYFTAPLKRTFRATSFDDLAFWLSANGAEYFEENKKLVLRGVHISRIFVVPDQLELGEQEADAISAHLRIGIEVRILSATRAARIAEDCGTERDPDFGLLDDYAVSFWHRSEGRALWISANKRDIDRYTKCFAQLECACMPLSKDRIYSAQEMRRIVGRPLTVSTQLYA